MSMSMPSREPRPIAPVPVTSAPIAPVPAPLSRRPALLGLLGLVGLIGCGAVEPVATHESETDPTKLYMDLTLELRAINLATDPPYDTIQLVATPHDGRGGVLANLPAPTFRLANPGDTAVLQVTPEGLVTAHAAGNQIQVIAELVAPGPVRHADTARINVTLGAPPAVLDSLSIEPASPESAVWPLYTNNMLDAFGLYQRMPVTPQALDAAGQPIEGLVIEFVSLEPAHATVSRWEGAVDVTVRHRPGVVPVVARTTAYGVTKVDTALYAVGWPLDGGGYITSGPSGTGVFEPAESWIRPNGYMVWVNLTEDSADVTFDDPANVVLGPAPLCDIFQSFLPNACGAGNVLIGKANGSSDPTNDNFRIRQFPVPGVYSFRNTRTGATGRVVVTYEIPADAGGP